MCYGSECLKENHMGDCRVVDFKPYSETDFQSPCVLYGCISEIMNYYLTIEEHEELSKDWSNERLRDLARERWAEDKERKQTIEEIEKLPWYDR